MAEHSVKLPEPRSDDSEDVVWGLSTASALWARGERKDAVVWIRRAAEAAEAAGNPFRASELGMYLPDLEKALLSPVVMPAEESAPVSDAAPISSFEVVLDADTPAPPVVLPPLSIPALGPVAPAAAPVAAQPTPAAAAPTTDPAAPTPPTMPPAQAAPTPPTMPPAQAAPTPPTMPPAQAAPTPPVVAAATSTAPTPATPTPAATNSTASSGRQTPIPAVPSSMATAPRASTPTPASLRPQTAVPRRSPSQVNMPAVAAAPRPASDSTVPARGSAVSPTPAAGTPAVAAPAVAAPAPVAPTPSAPPPEESPSIDEGRSALPPPAPMPNVAPAPAAAAASVIAAAATTSAAPQPTTPSPVPAAPKAAGAAQKRRQVLRTPILDPWSEASVREVKSPRERRRQQNAGDGGAGAARHRARMLLDEEDDDVLTSAPPLADILGKKHLGGPTIGGTGLAQAPPVPAAGRTSGTPAAPPPLPPRAPGAPAAGGRPPPLPPAVAAPTPAPPAVAMAGAPSSKTPSQPPPAAPAPSPSPSPVPAAAPAPAVSAAPTSAKNPTPAPPAPAAPTSAKTPTTPPPAAAPLAPKVPTPAPPAEDEEDGSEAPRRLNSARVPTPTPEAPQPPVPSQRAKPSTDAPDQSPASDIVPTAPRPLPRHSPMIPPAPKLPTGALGKPPVAARPNPAGDEAVPTAEDEQRRKFTDTLPSGITMSALVQAEAEASRNAAGPPQTPAGTKPLFEITKKPGAVPAPAAPRIPTPAPRPATIAPKAPSMPQSAGGIKPPPPSVGAPPAPPAPSAPTAKTRSSLPPPPTRESVAPPADPIRISNLELRGLEPFAHLPEEVQRTLVRTAIIEDVVPGESRSAFGAVLVVAGEVAVSAVNLNVPVKLASARSFIASRGSLAEPVPMRIVGGLSGATISRWSTEVFEQALNGHEQAVRDCRAASDSLQARIGLTLGALSEVDLETRDAMLSRLEVRVLEAGEAITDEDGPMPGLVFVVGGSVEILEGDPPNVVSDVRPGELLFPEALWAGAAAPLRSRASAMGALLLMGDRKLALDFAENVPIVGELLSR